MNGSLSSILQAAGSGGGARDWTGTDAGAVQARINGAMARTLEFLNALQAPGEPRGIMRMSAAHDAHAWPGVLLPASTHGLMCLKLFGGIIGFRGAERTALVHWFEQARRANGTFAISGMNENDVFKKPDRDETWRYIDFSVTNFTLGAIEALEPLRKPLLDFIEPWLDPLILRAWLAERDLREPPLEGNNIVNLASFLLLKSRHGGNEDRKAVKGALDILFDWHERNQEPATGFWGVGQGLSATQLLDAMAGSIHNYHLYYAMRRAVPHHDKAVDFALSLSPPKIEGAAIDLGLVDMLVHAAMLGDYRRDEITAWLARMLDVLLDYQNVDGGFPDLRTGTRRLDGWVRGYEEKQGLSNTNATYFRWVAIAMISDHLWPGWKAWGFRRIAGMGYRLDLQR